MEQPNLLGRAKRGAVRLLKRLLVIVVIVGAAVLAFGYFGVYDEGVRAGMVLRLSKKGLLFKTYEGQLNLQTFGALKGTSPIAETFDFSVERSNVEVIKALEEVALTGERVNLHYIKRYWTLPWRGNTKYFITKVERTGKPAGQ